MPSSTSIWRRVAGAALPVRFMHRVQASRDGAPGPTRTIVLNRTQGEDASADLRAAEVRFTRFFNSTPMAIAGVDQSGPHPAHQRAVPVAVLLGGRPRRGRPPRAARHRHPRARPCRLRRGAGEGPAAPGRHRADRHRAARQRGAPHALLRQRGRRRHRRRGRRGGGDRLCRRDDRAEGARGPDGAEPEDAGGRPACRRHRA